MSTTTPTDTPRAIGPLTIAACEAAYTDTVDDSGPGMEIRAARCDYSARGSRREHWYRMVWRGGEWQYLGDRRLGPVGLRADTRHQTTYGHVWPGELLVTHDRGGPVDGAWVVRAVADGTDLSKCLVRCEVARTRSGDLRITLPDGRTLDRPNPRRGV